VRPTYLLHLAGMAEPGKIWNAPENAYGLILAERWSMRFTATAVSGAVFAGTCANMRQVKRTMHGKPYADSARHLYEPAKTTASVLRPPLRTETVYSMAWGRGLPILYGPYEHPRRFVPTVILSLLRGERRSGTEGTQVRDLCRCAMSPRVPLRCAEPGWKARFNIASGRPGPAVRSRPPPSRAQLGAEKLLKTGCTADAPG